MKFLSVRPEPEMRTASFSRLGRIRRLAHVATSHVERQTSSPPNFAVDRLDARRAARSTIFAGQRFLARCSRGTSRSRSTQLGRLGDQADLDAVGILAGDFFAAILDQPHDVAGQAFGDQFRRQLGGQAPRRTPWSLRRRPAWLRLDADFDFFARERDGSGRRSPSRSGRCRGCSPASRRRSVCRARL